MSDTGGRLVAANGKQQQREPPRQPLVAPIRRGEFNCIHNCGITTTTTTTRRTSGRAQGKAISAASRLDVAGGAGGPDGCRRAGWLVPFIHLAANRQPVGRMRARSLWAPTNAHTCTKAHKQTTGGSCKRTTSCLSCATHRQRLQRTSTKSSQAEVDAGWVGGRAESLVLVCCLTGCLAGVLVLTVIPPTAGSLF